MSSVIARTGRHRQRYDENNFRLVSGCIPYKLTRDCGFESHDLENKIKVLMISSPNRDDLVFPKGGWENDETIEAAASREALEEAGVKGILIEKALGVWEFRSKSQQSNCSLEGACRGTMFALEVTEELDTWPEKETHDRIWLNIKDAYRLCRYEWMRRALEEFLRVMAESRRKVTMEAALEPLPMPVSGISAECGRSPSCNLKPSSAQQLEPVFRSCSRPKSCIQPGPNLGNAAGTTAASTRLNLKGTA